MRSVAAQVCQSLMVVSYCRPGSALFHAASQIWSEMFNVREMMNVLLVTYVALVAILVWIMGRWERSLRIPGYSV